MSVSRPFHTAFIHLAQYDYIPVRTPVSYPVHTEMLPSMIPHLAVGLTGSLFVKGNLGS